MLANIVKNASDLLEKQRFFGRINNDLGAHQLFAALVADNHSVDTIVIDANFHRLGIEKQIDIVFLHN